MYPFSRSRDAPGGQTDRYDEAKSLFAILRTRLKWRKSIAPVGTSTEAVSIVDKMRYSHSAAPSSDYLSVHRSSVCNIHTVRVIQSITGISNVMIINLKTGGQVTYEDTHIQRYAQAYLHTYVHTHTHTHEHTQHTYLCNRVYTHTHTHTYRVMHRHTYIHTYTHTHTHNILICATVYIYIYIYTHTHTHTDRQIDR